VPDERGLGRPLGEPRAVRAELPHALRPRARRRRARELGDVKYLLSPKDLAGCARCRSWRNRRARLEDRRPAEGAQYVATATGGYRAGSTRRERAPIERRRAAQLARDLLRDVARVHARLQRRFPRRQRSPDARRRAFPKHRGVYLGTRRACRRATVWVVRARPRRPAVDRRARGGFARGPAAGEPRRRRSRVSAADDSASDGPRPARAAAGMGVVFDAGATPRTSDEPGGPMFRVDVTGDGWRSSASACPGPTSARVEPATACG
jgi:putative protease